MANETDQVMAPEGSAYSYRFRTVTPFDRDVRILYVMRRHNTTGAIEWFDPFTDEWTTLIEGQVLRGIEMEGSLFPEYTHRNTVREVIGVLEGAFTRLEMTDKASPNG